MNFRTELNIPSAPFGIDHSSKIVAVGSCFAQNIAERLSRAKFDVTENPLGVMFNPCSVADTLDRLAVGAPFAADDLVESRGMWFSWSLHGSFAAADPCELRRRANMAVSTGKRALAEADTLIITLGTAWVYTLVATNQTVANCHKQPAELFYRQRLSVEESTAALQPLFEGALKNKRIILTVSPVRHLNDGLVENSLSKATLRVAASVLEQRCPNVWYFGAYELLNDDLRDYRFYADDMVHPSTVAVEYVWRKFVGAVMSPAVREAAERFERLSDDMKHRPLHPESADYQLFREGVHRRIEALHREFPSVDLSAETARFAK